MRIWTPFWTTVSDLLTFPFPSYRTHSLDLCQDLCQDRYPDPFRVPSPVNSQDAYRDAYQDV